jgi:ribosomal protein L40E
VQQYGQEPQPSPVGETGVDAVACMKCGTANLPDATFCNQCGENLKA